MRTSTRCAWGVFILLALAAGDLAARPRTFVAGQGVRMKVDVPPGYSFKVEPGGDSQVRVAMENPVWPIAIAVAIAPDHIVPAATEEAQRNLLVTQAAEILAQSKEQDYKFVSLNPVNGSGVYCVFTEPNVRRVEDLQPNEFMHIVAGIKTIRGAVMYFRIMCNDVKTPEYQEAIALFVSGFDEA